VSVLVCGVGVIDGNERESEIGSLLVGEFVSVPFEVEIASETVLASVCDSVCDNDTESCASESDKAVEWLLELVLSSVLEALISRLAELNVFETSDFEFVGDCERARLEETLGLNVGVLLETLFFELVIELECELDLILLFVGVRL
jgi:hypothetical protein